MGDEDRSSGRNGGDEPSSRRANGSVRRLVIVESPTKARKIAGYLGSNYIVESSRGHIRDLPRNAADVPAKYKSEPWARLGVNVEDNFEPLYIISPEKKSTVAELKDLLKDVDELYLATDGDREGEAIAWHLLETLKPRIPVKRMVFHEITEPAIRAAAEDPRDLDNDLVDAQETRRILDRLYGYEVSPVLWKKVAPKLSAGRVQSVATRIIVSRERERMAFRSAGYWDVTAQLDASVSDPQASPPTFTAKLSSVDGLRVAAGRDFDSLGALKKPDEVVVLDESAAGALAAGLRGAQLEVSSVEQKPYTRKPYAPFMTSTLQQEAGRKLRFSSERTMSIAQRLYENGYITYMRTDSTTLSQSAINAARNQARQLYGEEYLHPQPRQYTRKVKNAQEAHEAIRPAGDVFQTPGQLHSQLDTDEFRLYELIWQRTVASQMADARGTTLSLRISGQSSDGRQVVFNASGRTITFAGFLKAYVESIDDQAGGEADDAESRLPQLKQGQRVDAKELTADGHTTSPPARYTEASLIKALEDLGIGRPSTYSSIIKTIQDRGYVHKKGSALVPSWVAFAVTGLLEQHFSRLVDYGFTAAMEDELDEIAAGHEQRTNWLTNFYFGGEHGVADSIARSGGLKKLVGVNLEGIDAREVNSIKLFDDAEGRPIYVRVGKNGAYLERMITGEDGEPTPQRANLKDELTPDELTLELAEKLFSTPQEGRSLGIDPETGHEIVAKDGRYGPYVTEVLPTPDEPDDDAGATAKKGKKPTGPKPRTGSLLRSMDLETVTLEDALRLLSLPRVVGVDPTTGEEITAQNGRYGPYLKRGNDSRSLATEEQMFDITLEEALKIYAEPKRRGGQRASAPPLRELGNDPATGKPMVIKDGRFGPYVTDGETNASLRKGDDVLSLTDERAAELLADRRARGPVKRKKATKKAPAKKRAAKKA
ncbi:DNA topoisomerase I [Mycolicibacterium moriokaense]|uniref:DNA topoisomerase 1 n=1 Tax=Mycolicibacterium moriokaense TaxID=39691 RepID=A0AAD1H7T5_9MYCO|nr:type I DNA topoisomerase [Mycolicibacterium moriokaense]MCV7040148.1 type I DNA topoisomerase [Mycolicibacterium moriokaense]ORB20128.1 DNA topoisomerase I [Mycolicibacterium moriokaense]BBX00162.1 DNA topoisomerase 1 [Mycolicibacterium moriokaense]